MWSFFGKMQHDVQHAKSSPSIKRDIYNCENRFSETENLLLNNNLKSIGIRSFLITNGEQGKITISRACFGFLAQADTDPVIFYTGLNSYEIISGELRNVSISVSSGTITVTNNIGWSIPLICLYM